MVLSSLFLASCAGQAHDKPSPKTPETETTELPADNPNAVQEKPADGSPQKDTIAFPLPAGYKLLDEAAGDLDKDGISEHVIAFSYQKGMADLPEGGLLIYRKENGRWKEWHKAFGPVIMSDEAMMGGAPFQGIAIERHAIVVHHYTSANSFTHRYRINNGRWELIGATIVHESPRVTVDRWDYNLVTGNIEHSHTALGQTEAEGDKTTVSRSRKKRETLPEMNGFEPGMGEDY